MRTQKEYAVDPFILVEGPAFGDCEFYAKWFSAAATAENIWKEIQEDKEFLKEIVEAISWYIPDFAKSATEMLMELLDQQTTFVAALDLDNMEFAPMVDLGVFELEHSHYRMVVPTALSDARMRAALLRYAQTQDEEYVLHPEELVATMPYLEAKTQQSRLSALHKFSDADNHGVPQA